MSRKPWIDWDRHPLGEVPDATVAALAGCTVAAVRRARARRGIAACADAQTPPAGVDWDAQPLGFESDHALARRLGVHHSSVTAARMRRGIPAYDPQLEVARLRAVLKREGIGT